MGKATLTIWRPLPPSYLLPRTFLPVLLSEVRLVSTQPCSPSRVADFCVLRPARHTRVCLRGRVLHKSSHPRRFRSAAASKQAALGNSGRIRAGRAGYRARPGFLVVAPVRRRPAPAPSIVDTRRDTASSGYRLPCLACVSPCLSRTAVRRLAPLLLVSPPVPHTQSLTHMLAHSLPLAI